MTNDLPDPVIPLRVENLFSPLNCSVSVLMASGWSPEGANLDTTWNFSSGGTGVRGRGVVEFV